MPRIFFWPTRTTLIAIAIILVGIILITWVIAAGASPACMTKAEARAKFPKAWLYWHGQSKCWDDRRGPVQRSAVKYRGDPQTPPSMPVPRSTVLWPALSLAATPVDAALLTPEPATAWPLLLDVDEITGGPMADCCWPALDEPPFTDRWFALPSNWFAAVTR